MDRDTLVEQLRETLERHADEVTAAYLFDSVARGEATADSDVDVGILLSAGRPKTVAELPLALIEDLERAVALRAADVVVLNDAPPDLLHRVLRDGVLLVETDRRSRVEFEIRARNEYFDLQPMLERHRRALIRSA